MKILLAVLGICVILSAMMYTKGCEYERNVQEKNQNCAEMIFDAVQQKDFMNWSFAGRHAFNAICRSDGLLLSCSI